MVIDSAFVVIDTSVLISAAILPQSQLARTVELAVSHFVIAQSSATWQELVSKIERAKFDRYFGGAGRIKYLSKLAQTTRFFDVGTVTRVSRDPNDDMFLSLAVDSGSKIIISGDLDLRDIQRHRGIDTLSPSVFFDRFGR